MAKSWGLLFVLIGPAGVGKNALMGYVLQRLTDLQQLPTATTRPMRPGETQGREHDFITREEFQRLIDQNSLIEHQVVHENLYGTPRQTVEQALANETDRIADIEIFGAKALRSAYPHHAIAVFIQPPSTDDLRGRMEKRGESQAEIEKRMQRVAMEMDYAPNCDYLITNDDVDRAGEILYSIIVAERSRRDLLKLRDKKAETLPEGVLTNAMG